MLHYCSYMSSILGWSSFAGVAIVLVTFALNYPLAEYDAKVSKRAHQLSTIPLP